MFSALRRLTTTKTDGNNGPNTSNPPTGLHAMSSSLQKKFAKGVQYNMKIILKGDRNCGKTSLFRRLQGLSFVEEYFPTEEIQVANINWNYKTTDDVVKVEIWDVVDKAKRKRCIPGKLKIENLRDDLAESVAEEMALDASFVDVYKNSNGVIFVFDSTKNWTFEYVQRELPKVPNHIPILILSNRRDSNDRTIASDTVQFFIEGITRDDSAGEIVYTESSMRNGFGLKFVHKFFNLPFLQLQRETLLKQLETNESENVVTIKELSLFAESDDANYDFFVKCLSQKRRPGSDTTKTSETSKANTTSEYVGHKSKQENSVPSSIGNVQVQLKPPDDASLALAKEKSLSPGGDSLTGREGIQRDESSPKMSKQNNIEGLNRNSQPQEVESQPQRISDNTDILDFVPDVENQTDKYFLFDEKSNRNPIKVDNVKDEVTQSSDEDEYSRSGNPMVMSLVEDVHPANYSGTISATKNDLISSAEESDSGTSHLKNLPSKFKMSQSVSSVKNKKMTANDEVEAIKVHPGEIEQGLHHREKTKERKSRRRKSKRDENYDAFLGGVGEPMPVLDSSAYEAI